LTADKASQKAMEEALAKAQKEAEDFYVADKALALIESAAAAAVVCSEKEKKLSDGYIKLLDNIKNGLLNIGMCAKESGKRYKMDDSGALTNKEEYTTAHGDAFNKNMTAIEVNELNRGCRRRSKSKRKKPKRKKSKNTRKRGKSRKSYR